MGGRSVAEFLGRGRGMANWLLLDSAVEGYAEDICEDLIRIDNEETNALRVARSRTWNSTSNERQS